jgi:hypothetical protein
MNNALARTYVLQALEAGRPAVAMPDVARRVRG